MSEAHGLLRLMKKALRTLSAILIVVEGLVKVVAILALPVTWSVRVIGTSVAAYFLPRSTRRRVCENLKAVLGDAGRQRACQNIRNRYLSLMLAFPYDFVLGVRMTRANAGKIFVFEGFEHIDRALARENGVIGITAHYSCIFRAGFALGCSGYPVNAVVSNPADLPVGFLRRPLESFLKYLSLRTGMKWIYAGRAHSQVMDKLRSNEIIFYTVDVPRPTEDRGALRIRFLGGEVVFRASLIALAINTGAALVPIFVLPREGDHRCVIKVFPPIIPESGDTEAVRECLQRFCTMLESLIRTQPEFWWLWKDFHGFWKSGKREEGSMSPWLCS